MIIAFSKENGFPTLKEEKNLQENLLKMKKNLSFQKILKIFPDAKLLKVEEDDTT